MEEVSERTSLDFSMACSSSALRRISWDFSWDSWRMKAVIFLSSVATWLGGEEEGRVRSGLSAGALGWERSLLGRPTWRETCWAVCEWRESLIWEGWWRCCRQLWDAGREVSESH